MSAVPPKHERYQMARPDGKGVPTFEWTLTDSSITDTVKLIAGPFDVLPIVFVPGIMGSNLKSADKGLPIWRLDLNALGLPWNLVRGFAQKGPGPRQRLLHPERCVVDGSGAIPSMLHGSVHSTEVYRERGWGSVGEGAYHGFLTWLEDQLNPVVRNPARWAEYYEADQITSAMNAPGVQTKLVSGVAMGMIGQPFGAEKQPFVPILSDDLIARSRFYFPVYAVGYNWLASNDQAAVLLQAQIASIVNDNDKGQYRCQQVVLVTHSMGGLVARACTQLDGMKGRIAGIVHGAMPAVGAAVAYRRCKLGMRDEDFGAGLVIGSDGQEVTAVFAQAPGALQLLPSQAYAANWLRVLNPDGSVAGSWPAAGTGGNDPYSSIYLRRDRWWGLINEAWLAPKDGQPIEWENYADNALKAKNFHAMLARTYHPNTYSFFGADPKHKSFERVTWRMRRGTASDARPPPNVANVLGLGTEQLRMDGTTPEYVGGWTEFRVDPSTVEGAVATELSYWELHGEMQDGGGDGTVPGSSGAAPLAHAPSNVQQQFKLMDIEHESAFKDNAARRATLYAITKIVGKAKRPQ